VRIAQICGFGWQPKGTVRFRAFPLAAGLVAAGHEVTIFLTPYDNPQDSGREYTREGVRIVNVKLGKWPLARHACSCYRLCREAIHYDADVVHVFKPKGHAGAALTYLMATGHRHVVLDCDDWEGWGGWNDVKKYPWIAKEYVDLQEKDLIRRAPCVTVASRTLQARATELRRSPDRVLYLPNSGSSAEDRKIRARVLAMDTNELRRSFELGCGHLILYSGHFEPGDDGMFFSKAAAAVARKTDATILMAGDGPELARVKNFLASQEGARVRFFGQLPYERFLALVATADIAAYPYPNDAIHRAKCSARIIDYMAMGCAVVTTRVGENNDYIEHGVSGILAPPENEEQFGLALENLLRDSQLRACLGANARRHVEERLWSAQKSVETCLAAYRMVLRTDASSQRPEEKGQAE